MHITKNTGGKDADLQKSKAAFASRGCDIYNSGGLLVSHQIQKLLADSIKVEDGFLYYEEVGRTWFLTPAGAAHSIGAKLKTTFTFE